MTSVVYAAVCHEFAKPGPVALGQPTLSRHAARAVPLLERHCCRRKNHRLGNHVSGLNLDAPPCVRVHGLFRRVKLRREPSLVHVALDTSRTLEKGRGPCGCRSRVPSGLSRFFVPSSWLSSDRAQEECNPNKWL
eukprot:3732612-Amphidinium_carterae.1